MNQDEFQDWIFKKFLFGHETKFFRRRCQSEVNHVKPSTVRRNQDIVSLWKFIFIFIMSVAVQNEDDESRNDSDKRIEQIFSSLQNVFITNIKMKRNKLQVFRKADQEMV